MANLNSKKITFKKYETNIYNINEEFKNISIITNTANITFLPAKTARVVCHEQKNERHLVEVKDGTLFIKIITDQRRYRFIGISFSTPKITVYLPVAQYEQLIINAKTGDISIPKDFCFGDTNIATNTGDIKMLAGALGNATIGTRTGEILLQNTTAANMELLVSTGKIEASNLMCSDIKINVGTGATVLYNVNCKNIVLDGGSGDTVLKNVIANEKINITRGTADIKFDRIDAAELFIKIRTGDVNGSILSDKVFIINSGTGDVHVPKTNTGGRCEITSRTGDIKIKIAR